MIFQVFQVCVCGEEWEGSDGWQKKMDGTHYTIKKKKLHAIKLSP